MKKKSGFFGRLFGGKEKNQPEVVLFTDENGTILKDQTLQENTTSTASFQYEYRKGVAMPEERTQLLSDEDEKTILLNQEEEYEPTILLGDSTEKEK